MTDFIYPILAYLAGSIPFGVILTKFFGKGDIRKLGSGNIGATNVVRTQGMSLGVMVFLLDFLKGFLACKFLHCNSEWAGLAVVAAPVLGHTCSVWLKFRGGKGIATYFGVLAAIDGYMFAATAITWVAIFLVIKISAVAGLVSCSTSLLYFYYIRDALGLQINDAFWVLFGLVIVIFVKHHKNIAELLDLHFDE